jgi:hypothetical protein
LAYTANDGVNTPQAAQRDVHFSSFRIRQPRVGVDNRIGAAARIPFTWVIAGSAMTGSGMLNTNNLDLITAGGGISGSPIVSSGLNPLLDVKTFDLDGNPVNVSSMLSVAFLSNDRSNPNFGKFQIVPVLDGQGKPVLDEPVVVSFLVEVPGGTSDWSGANALLAPALTPGASLTVEDFSGFEGFAAGSSITADIGTGGQNGWAIVPAQSDGQHQFVTSGYPTPWAGAASGNVLKVTVGTGSGTKVRIISLPVTPIEMGATYGLSLNVATNSSSSANTPRVFLRAIGQPAGDNTTGLKVGRSAMPTLSDGWKQLFTTYTAPLMHGSVPGANGTGSYNFHYQGVRLYLQFAAFPSTADISLFVDNVYFYKLSNGPAANIEEEGTADVDLSVGKTAMDLTLLANASAVPTPVQGDFEGGTTLAALGWEFTEDVSNTTFSLSNHQAQPKAANIGAGQTIVEGLFGLEQSAADHTGRATSTNSFFIQLNGAAGREATGTNVGIRYALRGLYDGNGDVSGPAVYTMRCFLQSDANTMAEVPLMVFGMTNVGTAQFDALATTTVQGPGLPWGANNINGVGDWRRLQLTGSFLNITESPLQPLAVYFQSVARVNTVTGGFQTAVPVATYAADPVLGTAGAGYDDRTELSPHLADATVYIDDMTIEKVNPKAEYYDAALLADPEL